MRARTLSLGPVIRLMLMLVLSWGTGCSKEAKVARHRERAQEAFAAERYEEAIIEASNAFRLDQADPEVIRILALAHLKSQKFASAFQLLRRAVELLPEDLELRRELARLFFVIRDFDEVRQHAGWVLERQPADLPALKLWCAAAVTPSEVQEALARLDTVAAQVEDKAAVQVLRGRLAVVQNDLGAAEEAFKSAAELDPKSEVSRVALGEVYLRQGNTNRAVAEMEAAARLGTDSPYASMRWADLKRQAGEAEESEAILRDLVASNPDYPVAGLRLAQMEAAEGKVEAAWERVKGVIEKTPAYLPARAFEARLRWAKGDAAGAAEELERLAKQYPSFAPFPLTLGMILASGPNPERAVEPLQSVLAVAPGDPEARLALAEVRLRLGDSAQAIEALEGLMRETTNSPKATLLLGRAYFGQRRYGDAAQAFDRLAGLLPREPQAYYLRGVALQAAEQPGRARESWEKALELNPRFTPALWQIADSLRQEKGGGEAIARVRRYLEGFAEISDAWMLLGTLAQRDRDVPTAEAAFRKVIELAPDKAAGYQALSRLCEGTARTNEAVQLIGRAMEIAPTNVTVLTQAAVLHHRTTGDLDKAREYYGRVLEVQPNSAGVANNLAVLYADIDLDRAFALAQQAYRSVTNSPPIQDTLGWITYRRGDARAAQRLLQSAADRVPDDPEIQYHLGVALSAMGREGEARAALARALESRAGFAERRGAEVLAGLLAAAPLAPPKTDLNALPADLPLITQHPSVLMRKAMQAERDGDAGRAAEVLKGLLDKQPAYFPAVIELARLESRTPEGAKASLERLKAAQSLRPDEPSLALALANALFDEGDALQAAAIIDQWRRESERDPAFRWAAARAAYAKGDSDGARRLAEGALTTSRDFNGAAAAASLVEMIDLERAGNFDAAAMAKIQAALAANPRDPSAKMALAASYEKAGDVGRATALWEEVLQRQPGFPPARQRLGEALYVRGFGMASLEPGNARATLSRALELHPESRRAAAARDLIRTLEARARTSFTP